MEKRRLGSTGLHVTVLGFGGAEIGYDGASQKEVETLLNGALDAGLNVIDTAECYVDSEEKIGRAVSSRRDDYYLFTKCGHVDESMNADWSAPGILSSIERSLQRLQTDYLDLVQLHSCSEEELKRGEVIDALQTARAKGLVRFIGYSGDGSAARFAIECGQFDTLQTSISLADQEALDLTIPLANERDMGVIAKRPLANTAWRYRERPDNSYHIPYWERFQHLDYEFLKGNIDEAVGIALRFTLSVPGVHTAIVGTSKPGRWIENARLLDTGLLPKTQFQAIRQHWSKVADESWVGQI